MAASLQHRPLLLCAHPGVILLGELLSMWGCGGASDQLLCMARRCVVLQPGLEGAETSACPERLQTPMSFGVRASASLLLPHPSQCPSSDCRTVDRPSELQRSAD